MRPLYRLEKAMNLPEGHTDLMRAREAVDREYAKAFRVERFWRNRSPNFLMDAPEALRFANSICLQLGEPVLRKVVCSSPEVLKSAAAHYNACNREIHVAYERVSIFTLIHELGHHFSPRCAAHGRGYCEVLHILFSVVYSNSTGKKPKPDWDGKVQKLLA